MIFWVMMLVDVWMFSYAFHLLGENADKWQWWEIALLITVITLVNIAFWAIDAGPFSKKIGKKFGKWK